VVRAIYPWKHLHQRSALLSPSYSCGFSEAAEGNRLENIRFSSQSCGNSTISPDSPLSPAIIHRIALAILAAVASASL